MTATPLSAGPKPGPEAHGVTNGAARVKGRWRRILPGVRHPINWSIGSVFLSPDGPRSPNTRTRPPSSRVDRWGGSDRLGPWESGKLDVPRAVFHTATGMPSTRNGSVPPRVGNTRSGSAEGKPGADTERSVWQAWGVRVPVLRPSTGSGEYPKGNGRIIHGGVFSASVQSPPGGRLIARFGRHALIRPPLALGALARWGS